MKKLLVVILLLSPIVAGAATIDKGKLRRMGYHPTIDSIAILGNEHFSNSEIRSRLYSRVRNPWLALKRDRRSRIQRESINRDTLEVKYLYLSSGFLGVKVDWSYQWRVNGDTLDIVQIKINEGRQFFVGDRIITGSFKGKFANDIRNIIHELRPRDPISPFRMNQIATDVKTYLANRGYPYAEVRNIIDTAESSQSCKITFEIKSDSLVHFGDVEITGADHFPAYAARRELRIEPGAIYSREDILESQRRLFESGYYSTFQLRKADTVENRLRPDFVLRLRERKPWNVTFKFGAGQSEVRDLQWDASASLGQRNFLGSRRWDALVDYSFELGTKSRLIANRYRLRFTEPWLFGIRMPITLTGQVQPRTKDPVQEFDRRSWSASAVVSKWFTRELYSSVGLEYRFVKISGASAEIVETAKTLEGNSARRRLYATIKRDSRDDVFIPSRGSVTELSGDYFGGFLGGDDSFFKINGSWSRYRVIWPGWIAATRIKGGWAEEFGQTVSVPLDEALYLGGANTVRGFRENRLGPTRDDGTPEGARYIAVFNQEFRWKTVQLHRELPFIGGLFRSMPLWQSIFVDVGNGYRNLEEVRFDNVAISYGTGLQLISPAGPIRVDYAQVVPTERFSFAHRWHFTILYAF